MSMYRSGDFSAFDLEMTWELSSYVRRLFFSEMKKKRSVIWLLLL